jgi:hypothetical protein
MQIRGRREPRATSTFGNDGNIAVTVILSFAGFDFVPNRSSGIQIDRCAAEYEVCPLVSSNFCQVISTYSGLSGAYTKH